MDVKKIGLVGVLGLVAVVGFVQLQKMSTPVPQKRTAAPVVKEVSVVEYVDVLVAKQDIMMGTRLNAEYLEWTKWPAEALSENLIDNKTHPDGIAEYTNAVTRTAIYTGEPILTRKVVIPGGRGPMSALLNSGMRGTAVRINVESAAGGFIQPGDRVDVVLTTRVIDTISGRTNYVSETMFENVAVMSIGKTHSNSAEGTAYVTGSTALLQLSQEDSEHLIEAQSRGDISLLLRGLDRRQAAFIPSSSKVDRAKKTKVTSMTIIRAGQPQQVAIQGQ